QFGDLFTGSDAYLNGTNYLGRVIGMNLSGDVLIESRQQVMEVGGTSSFSSLTKTLAQSLQSPRTGEQSFQECPEVESGAADYDGHTLSIANFTKLFSSHSRVFASRDVTEGIHNVKEMVWNSC